MGRHFRAKVGLKPRPAGSWGKARRTIQIDNFADKLVHMFVNMLGC
jgi:hypothetical protein